MLMREFRCIWKGLTDFLKRDLRTVVTLPLISSDGGGTTGMKFISSPQRKTQTSSSTPFDVQVGGQHYRTATIEPIEFIMSQDLPFSEGNVVKYMCRHRHKNGAEDLKKAKHYIDFILHHEYGE